MAYTKIRTAFHTNGVTVLERILEGLFRPVHRERRCLAATFLAAVGKGNLVRNPITLTTTQGVIILGVLALMFGGAMEFAGKPAPTWLTSLVGMCVTYLAGVATPSKLDAQETKELKQ